MNLFGFVLDKLYYLFIGGIVVLVVTLASIVVRNEMSLQQVPGNKLFTMINGNTLTGLGYQLYCAKDGTMLGIVHGYTDRGTWHMAGDQYCTHWTIWNDA